ncbi:hypothetical protein DSUL_30055 [Desulfovibrionales bacterium]
MAIGIEGLMTASIFFTIILRNISVSGLTLNLVKFYRARWIHYGNSQQKNDLLSVIITHSRQKNY